MRVALLHTSFVFVTSEPLINDLIAELLPGADVIHFVDSQVLADVQREGRISAGSRARMRHLAHAAEAADADVIFSVCSSLGPAIDAAVPLIGIPIVKIDSAMARVAAARGGTVGVLATVPTTLRPTSDLIRRQAAELHGRTVVVQELCEGAFDALLAGDRERHDRMVEDKAAELAGKVDTIVLAQASMSRLAEPLAALTGVTVLASPRLGVEELAQVAAQVAL